MLRPPGAPSLSRRNLPFYSVDSFLVFALAGIEASTLDPRLDQLASFPHRMP